MEASQSVLLTRICGAFPRLVPDTPAFLPLDLTTENIAEIAAGIGTFYREDIPSYLGALLYAALTRRPLQSPDVEWLEKVIYFLSPEPNAPVLRRESESAFITSRKEDFSALSREQKETVLDWVEAAATWPELSLFRDDLLSAGVFWRRISRNK